MLKLYKQCRSLTAHNRNHFKSKEITIATSSREGVLHELIERLARNRRSQASCDGVASRSSLPTKLDTYSFYKDEKTGEESVSFVTYDPRTMCSLNLTLQMPRGITCGFMADNLFNYKDKSADAGVQVPQKGISFVGSLSINLADLLKL